MANENQATKVITKSVRFSYLKVWEPEAIDGGDDKKFSVSLIIPKSDKQTVAAIEKAIAAAQEAGKSKWGGKVPARLKVPLRDGDEERSDDENYANSYFVNASCKTAPGLCYQSKDPKTGERIKITDPTDLYSGCYGVASITFYAFDTNGNRGIACGLNNLMKLSDGAPLGGRNSAEVDFADIPDDVVVEDDFLG